MEKKKAGFSPAMIPLLVLAVAAIAIAVLLGWELPEKRRELQMLTGQLDTLQQQNLQLTEAFTNQQGLIRQQQADNEALQQRLAQAMEELEALQDRYGPLENEAG